LLGVFYMGGIAHGFKNVYFAGVLHRIAVAYFFTALIFCFFRTRAMIVLCLSLITGYWVLMTFVPIRGLAHPPSLNREESRTLYRQSLSAWQTIRRNNPQYHSRSRQLPAWRLRRPASE